MPAVAAGAGSLPAALSAARLSADRAAVLAGFGAGARAGLLTGAAAVLAGGLLTALLLRRTRPPRR